MFKTGDKVRFLNDAIEGTVLAIISGDLLEITDSYGFTRRISKKELVRVESSLDLSSAKPSIEDVNIPASVSNQLPIKQLPLIKDGERLSRVFDHDEAILAVFEMVQPTSPLTSDVVISLVNTTSLYVSFLAAREQGEFRLVPVVGQVEPRTGVEIGRFTQDQLNRMDGLEFQFMFYNTVEYRPRQPLMKHLAIRPSDLLEVVANGTGPHHERFLKSPLVVLREEQLDVTKLLKRFSSEAEELRLSSHARKQKSKGDLAFSARQRIVDLHIEELIKDPKSLSASQIIAHQLSVFDREMNQALLEHLSRITFIHGVGSGVLRSSIREALKKFDHIRFSDAPPEKFGNGATQVDFT